MIFRMSAKYGNRSGQSPSSGGLPSRKPPVTIPLPLALLIETRLKELGMDCQALGRRLGYQNPLKAAGRVDALCWGHITSRKSRAALARLPAALEVSSEIVEEALEATQAFLAENDRRRDEARRLIAEAEETEWRARFRPHAVIETERTIPTQITACGLTGGAERWLQIDFDLTRPPITFVQQAVAALPEKIRPGTDGRQYVTFFGEALRFIVNYSPDQALRCDLKGNPLEVLPKAYRPGQVMVSVGGCPVSPSVVVRLLGMS